MSDLECIVDAKAVLGEGVFWDERENLVYWVDIDGCQVHRYDPVLDRDESRDLGKKVGTVGATESGRLAVGLQDGFYVYDFGENALEKRCDPMEGNPDNRFNDGKPGPDGRFYIGCMGERNRQSLYRIDADGAWAEIESGISCSNGVVWSLDHSTLYYIDSPTQKVVAYDFDKSTGSIRNRRTVVDVSPELGIPDGMTIDSEGMLWVAHWQGYCVRRWNPDTGEEIGKIDVPVERVTSCAFGGTDLRDLYITTASVEMTADDWTKYPSSGGLFRIKLDTPGIPSFRFRDQ